MPTYPYPAPGYPPGWVVLAPPGPAPPFLPDGVIYDDELGYLQPPPSVAPPTPTPTPTPEPAPFPAPAPTPTPTQPTYPYPAPGYPPGWVVLAPPGPAPPFLPDGVIYDDELGYLQPPPPAATPAEPTPEQPPTGGDAADEGDLNPDYEAGIEWTDDLLDAWEQDAREDESGAPKLVSGDSLRPGQIFRDAADHKQNALGNWWTDNAVDIYLHLGTKIVAVADGYVSGAVGPCVGTKIRTGPTTPCSKLGYGLCDKNATVIRAGYRLFICHDNGMKTFYHHMTELTPKPGARVRQGDTLGYSGISNGYPQLHFAVSTPYVPSAFYLRSFRLGERKPRGAPGLAPPTPPVAVPPPGYRAPTLEAGWGNLMDIFARDWPNDARAIARIRRDMANMLK